MPLSLSAFIFRKGLGGRRVTLVGRSRRAGPCDSAVCTPACVRPGERVGFSGGFVTSEP